MRSEGEEAGTLAFRPPDGVLKVGESKEIECVLTGAGGSSTVSLAQFGLTDLHEKSSLLSTDVASLPVRVKPPVGHESYPIPGSTVIQCSYEMSGGVRLVQNLTVRVLREWSIGFLCCSV